MKEFPYSLSGMLIGIQPDYLGTNKPGTLRCKGLLPAQGIGLQRSDWPVLSPIDSTIWPFPQVFKGKTHTLYVDGSAVYSLNTTTWKTTLLTTCTRGHAWDFVDMNDTWILTNGKSVVVRKSDGTYTEYTTPPVASACYHRGRVVYGGLDSSFWSDAWQTEWSSWIEQQDTGITVNFDFAPNSIYWTGIGAGDVLMPFDRTGMISGPLASGFDSTRPFYLDLLARGDMGHMQMPWQGSVYRVLPLGKALMVYGSNGISMMMPYVDPIPTYGEHTISNIGIPAHGCVGGDDNAHIYIDNMYDLHIVTGEGDKALGYRSEMKKLDIGAVWIVKDIDNKHQRFYISDGNISYCINEVGLAEVHQMISSMFYTDGRLLFVGSEDTDLMIIESAPFNMGLPAIKQIRAVSIDYDNIDNLTIEVKSRFEGMKDFLPGIQVRPINNTFVYSGVAGIDFKVIVRGTPREDAVINSIDARWCLIDKRGIRGPYGTDSSEQ